MTEENKAIVRGMYQAFDSNDFAAVEKLLSNDFSFEFAGMPRTDGAGFTQFVRGFYAGFPDLTHTIEDIAAEDDKVCVRLRVRGTHRGEFMGIPPSEKPADFAAMTLIRFANGKIVEIMPLADSLTMLQQIGAVPAPA